MVPSDNEDVSSAIQNFFGPGPVKTEIDQDESKVVSSSNGSAYNQNSGNNIRLDNDISLSHKSRTEFRHDAQGSVKTIGSRRSLATINSTAHQ